MADYSGMWMDGGGMDTLFGPSVLTGNTWGTPNSDILFPTTDSNTATFPWLSNAPAGSVFAPSAPAVDLVDSGTAGSGDTSFWNNLPSFNFGGLNFGSMWNSMQSTLPSADTASRLIPGTMALTYAASQPTLDLGNLNSILGRLGGNQDAVVKAATDPLQRNIAAGYGDLLQSQALRGIRGSSFGDSDIGNYIATTGNALANAGANAAQGSLGLQSDLATKIAVLQNQRQQMKNQLYGTAFDVLGRGLNPSGYASTINVGGGGGAVPLTAGAGDQTGRLIGSLLGAGGGALLGGPVGAGVGMGLGGMLGGLF